LELRERLSGLQHQLLDPRRVGGELLHARGLPLFDGGRVGGTGPATRSIALAVRS
jgi:hypothetical protein